MGLSSTVLLVALSTAFTFYIFSSPPSDALLSASSHLKNWYFEGLYHNYHGYAIFYKISQKSPPENSKPTLLLLHGFPTSSYDYYQMWGKLEDKFHLITLDFLGFGFSDKPYPHNYSLVEQTDLVKSLLKKLEVSRFHILAHDVGVLVTQELVAQKQYGEHDLDIESVVFLNAALFPSEYRPIFVQHILTTPSLGPILSKILPYFAFTNSLQKLFGEKYPITDELKNDLYALITHKHGKDLISDLLGYIRERQVNEERWVGGLKWGHEISQKTGKVNLPMFIINGPSDPVSGKHVYDHYMRSLPNAKGKLLGDGVAHLPLIQDAEGSTKAFLDFHSTL